MESQRFHLRDGSHLPKGNWRGTQDSLMLQFSPAFLECTGTIIKAKHLLIAYQGCAGTQLTTRSPQKKQTLMCSICQLLWRKYCHLGRCRVFQVASLHTKLGREKHGCFCSPRQPAAAHCWHSLIHDGLCFRHLTSIGTCGENDDYWDEWNITPEVVCYD